MQNRELVTKKIKTLKLLIKGAKFKFKEASCPAQRPTQGPL